ncbi:hypothetical protein PspTeo4_13728 [Pseudomonas sp. Teo4]|nr:hypothetical protein [Pseudomonas sp. Teo4]
MLVAGRVGHRHQRLHATLLDGVGSADLPVHATAFKVFQRLVERLLRGQLPAAGQVARRIALDDQHAERALVHLHVQAAAGCWLYLHAEHIFGVALPLAEVLDLRDEVAQAAYVDHAGVPPGSNRCLGNIVQSAVAGLIVR